MADLTPEALAPLLYLAYVTGMHEAALQSPAARAAALASVNGFSVIAREYRAGWTAAATEAHARLAPAHAALTGQLATQHEAMTQLRADHSEAVARWQQRAEETFANLARVHDLLDQAREIAAGMTADDEDAAELLSIIREALGETPPMARDGGGPR